MSFWTTKDGKEIKYKDLKTSHLVNILKYIKKKSCEGITLMSGGGFDSDEMWYDEETINGEEALQHFDYYGLKSELNKRNDGE